MGDDKGAHPRRHRGRDTTLQVAIVPHGRLRADGLGSWLERSAPRAARGTVTVALLPDARVRALNRQYRRVDRTTDVLSFPAAADPAGGHVVRLGDIAIATGVARRQARQAGHPVETELRILALHGLLHLLGYDHERDNGRMARVERRLRRRSGLVEGLIERSRR
ncbi:MAG: rRNA maturation RNase YbeY [Acidimicrobiia bacterium]|nr:rRNA maturation RNase YbeY [Acidimicrobiia bacterium]